MEGAGRAALPRGGAAAHGSRSAWPAALLLLLVLVQGVWLQQAGRLEPRRVPDTQTYLTAAKISGNLEAALSYRRTTGYGRFLRLFARDDWSFALRWVPVAQLMVFDASVLLLFAALGRFLTSRWLAFAAAAPLVGSPALRLVDRLQPDFLALAFVVSSFAFLMLLVERRTWPRWAGLVVSVFVSYQLRPAGFFVIVLLPLLGGLWLILRDGKSPRRALAFAGWVALATVGPYLAFATLRLVEVGHFGLVSFGGCNAAGVAILFLDDELAAELPPPQAELAETIIRLREKRGLAVMAAGDDPEAFWGQYSDNVFRVGLSAATWDRKRRENRARREGVTDPSLATPRLVEANNRLSALAGEVFRRRPRMYARWVLTSLELGLRQLARLRWIVVPSVLLLASVPAARSVRRRRPGLPPSDPAGRLRRRALACFALGAVGYYAAYILGISLVSLPFERYFLSTVVFLPGVLTALVAEIWTAPVRAALLPSDV